MAVAARLARGHIYYGWYIVAVAFLCNFVVLGLSSASPAVFLKPMTEELGWSRGFFSLATSLGIVISAPLGLVLGPFVDRRGARGLMIAGGIAIGLATAGLGLVHEKWQFLVLRTILAPLAMAGLGQLATQVSVSNWLIKKRGRALSFTAMGWSAGSLATIPLANYLISAVGWRYAWLVLGLTAVVLVVVPAAVLMKRRPENLGLLPDGQAAVARGGPSQPVSPSEVVWTRREAMRTSALWLFAFGFPIGWLASTAITQHLYSHLTDIDLSRNTATVMTMMVSFGSLVSKPVWGFIAERFSPKYCLAVMYAMLGTGMGLLVLVGANQGALYFVTAFMGSALGGILLIQALLWAEYYGRMSLGKVQSVAMVVSSLINPMGPVLAGFMWDITGSYRGIFTGYIGAEALALLCILLTRPPRKKGELAPSPALSPAGR